MDFPIPLPAVLDDRRIEQSIELAIQESGLRLTLRTTLKKCPGCTHWHLKKGRESGTFEITFWPIEHRAWFTTQSGRTGKWIDQEIKLLASAIERRLNSA